MTVQQLIEWLENVDPTAEVVLARDPEGNSFAVLDIASEGFFDNKYSEFSEEDVALDNMNDEIDDMEDLGGVPSICLWPAY